MKRSLIFVLILATAGQLVAKDKKGKISIRILDSASTSVVSGHVAGTEAHTSTSCAGSGTTNVYGTATDSGPGTTSVTGTANSQNSSNCETVYHDATPPRDTYVTHVIMSATIPSLNKDVMLWCAVQWRQCEALSPGSYEAEIKNDVVWIYAFGGTRPLKIKYRIVDPTLFGINDGTKAGTQDDNSKTSGAGCSVQDSREECEAVMDCMRGGGTHEYCEMMHGGSSSVPE